MDNQATSSTGMSRGKLILDLALNKMTKKTEDVELQKHYNDSSSTLNKVLEMGNQVEQIEGSDTGTEDLSAYYNPEMATYLTSGDVEETLPQSDNSIDSQPDNGISFTCFFQTCKSVFETVTALLEHRMYQHHSEITRQEVNSPVVKKAQSLMKKQLESTDTSITTNTKPVKLYKELRIILTDFMKTGSRPLRSVENSSEQTKAEENKNTRNTKKRAEKVYHREHPYAKSQESRTTTPKNMVASVNTSQVHTPTKLAEEEMTRCKACLQNVEISRYLIHLCYKHGIFQKDIDDTNVKKTVIDTVKTSCGSRQCQGCIKCELQAVKDENGTTC